MKVCSPVSVFGENINNCIYNILKFFSLLVYKIYLQIFKYMILLKDSISNEVPHINLFKFLPYNILLDFKSFFYLQNVSNNILQSSLAYDKPVDLQLPYIIKTIQIFWPYMTE
jgi:hypothetical protein